MGWPRRVDQGCLLVMLGVGVASPPRILTFLLLGLQRLVRPVWLNW